MNEIDPTTGFSQLLPTTEEVDLQTTTLQDAGLDRDAFLTIFLAQLENQDPLDPQDAAELGAQLATFSQLEQSIVMADELRGVNERLDKMSLEKIESRAVRQGTAEFAKQMYARHGQRGWIWVLCCS